MGYPSAYYTYNPSRMKKAERAYFKQVMASIAKGQQQEGLLTQIQPGPPSCSSSHRGKMSHASTRHWSPVHSTSNSARGSASAAQGHHQGPNNHSVFLGCRAQPHLPKPPQWTVTNGGYFWNA